MTFDRYWGDSGEDDDFEISDIFERSHSHHSSVDMGFLSTVAGALVGCLVLALLLYWCCCRPRSRGRVLRNPPPPPATSSLPPAAYPRQEYLPHTVTTYTHNATIQTSPHPVAALYPATVYSASVQYPAGSVYPTANPPYPPTAGYPAANLPYPTTTGYSATNPPYPTTAGYPATDVYPSAPTAPDVTALPPSYDQAVAVGGGGGGGGKQPPYNPQLR